MPLVILIYNADGTLNKNGSIKEFATLQLAINDYYEHINLTVTELGDTDLFLGHDWLKIHNLSIDWVNAILFFDYCSETCGYRDSLELDELNQDMHYEWGKEDQIFFFDWNSYVEKTCQVNQLFKLETVSDYTKEFPKVFSEEEFDHLPERHSWDYAIKLTPKFTLADCKIYLLNYKEQ